jgi:uncharacterized protein YyaL (SSP411 family)
MASRTLLACVLSAGLLLQVVAADSPTYTNRLAKEKSPYLLQHAHNPVDWFPWGDEAFEKARRENKPVFLSVGYSTCHWCHVMERESFSDPEIAKLINDNFVPVKVDREERPDVDRVYMTFVQATTGSGGWPMTVFLTPDRKPFFGGTYFPPEPRQGLPGIKAVLAKVREAWDTQHDDVVKSAESLTQAIGQMQQLKPADGGGAVMDGAMLDRCFDQLGAAFDTTHGGFGAAPKFPEPVNFNFLFHYAARTQDNERRQRARDMALRTLKAIAAGGIHDHLGGGFHRYSTDRRWFLPHFEKMLYDQAQLARCYVDAYRVTGDEAYAQTARDALDYVLRDLTGPDGQFYSAEDADSARDPSRPDDKAEGAFYVWRGDEIEKILGHDVGAVFNFHYGVGAEGNVPKPQDPRGEFPGLNVLAVARTPEETARQFNLSVERANELLAAARKQLFDVRAKRPRPHRDDKAVTAWNGLAISAFARAGGALAEPRYTDAATRAAAFVQSRLYDAPSRTLKRVWRDGPSPVPGFLDDHAFLIQGLLDLYEATLDVRWLKWAVELQQRQDELFGDAAGGYFTTSGADPSILTRGKDEQEGVEPAANSISALNLLRLSQMLDDPALAARAEGVFRVFSGRIAEHPSSMPQMLVALDFHLAKPVQIVLAGDAAAESTKELLHAVHRRYGANRIVLGADGGAGQAFLAARAKFIDGMKTLDGKATAYVCRDYACQKPTSDVEELQQQLDR